VGRAFLPALSRKAAQECSPRRKPWVAFGIWESPVGAKEFSVRLVGPTSYCGVTLNTTPLAVPRPHSNVINLTDIPGQ